MRIGSINIGMLRQNGENFSIQISELLKSAAAFKKEAAKSKLERDKPSKEVAPDKSDDKKTDPAVSEPPANQPPAQSVKDDTFDDLAAMYVQQYQEGSGKELTEEEKKQKKAEVAAFYSRMGETGRERLDKIVFAND